MRSLSSSTPPLHIYGILRPMESMSPTRPALLQHRDLDPWWRRVVERIAGVLFGGIDNG